MINLSVNELKYNCKNRDIKDSRNKSEDDLIKILSEPKTKISLSKKRLKKIKEKFNELRDEFSKPEIKEIRKNPYEIKKKKSFCIKNERDWKNLLESEKNIFKPKKYYVYDDTEYRGIRDVKNLFNLSVDKDYHKPTRTNSTFNRNYIEYESKRDKDKVLSLIEYLNMIRTYFGDIANDHKIQGE